MYYYYHTKTAALSYYKRFKAILLNFFLPYNYQVNVMLAPFFSITDFLRAVGFTWMLGEHVVAMIKPVISDSQLQSVKSY